VFEKTNPEISKAPLYLKNAFNKPEKAERASMLRKHASSIVRRSYAEARFVDCLPASITVQLET
jgi:hypothetical protein